MKFMLDTNICIYLIKKKSPKILRHLQKTRISDICISSITLSELEYGVAKSAHRNQNKIALTEFMAPIEIMPYDDLVAPEYGIIRAVLEQKGQTIGPLDMLIAAHALALNVTLVSNNVREFKRIPKLKVENWAK